MTASHKSNIAKKKLRVKSSTLYRIVKKFHSIKTPLFICDKNFESNKEIYFFLTNKNKGDIIIELEKEEKGINLTHLIRSFGHLAKCFPSKKGGKEYSYFKSDINKLLQLLKIKVNGKIRINHIYLYSKNNSKDFKNKEKKNSYLKDKNKTTNSIDSTEVSCSKTDNSINFSFSKKHYCNYYPKRSEMKERVGKKPCHFPIECFHGVNQHHNEIGNKKYLNLNDIIESFMSKKCK